MKHPVCYYFKCSKTGVELNFTRSDMYGWCVGFPNMRLLDDSPDVLLREAGVEIPWPELTDDEKVVVDENYKKLHKMMEEDDG